jgi:hypothetical protein
MKEGDKIYDDIQKVLNDLPADFNILEEQIDIEDQMKYFEFSRKIREEGAESDYIEKYEDLFSSEVTVERKKEILAILAVTDDVRAYRILEKYVKEASSELKNWATLALQESRMLIQSSLLNEKQVFISTGLGGKGKKLRYYMVFINRSIDKMLNETQQKLVKDELIFALQKEEGEFESIDFSAGFSSSLILLPVTVDIKKMFGNVIEECNQYGNFLSEDMIITNVKVLSRSEILGYLEDSDKKDSEKGLEEF